MFHVSDGLFFERVVPTEINPKKFGGVRIIKRKEAKDDSPIVFEQFLDAESWASVVASMTVLGESGGLWRAIVALQKGG